MVLERIFLIGQSQTRTAYGGHGNFVQAKQFQRRCFRNWPTRNKNCLWWPCLLTDQDEIINLYRRPYIDASYQVSVQFAKWIQRRGYFYVYVNCCYRILLIYIFLSITSTITINRTLTNPPFSKYI